MGGVLTYILGMIGFGLLVYFDSKSLEFKESMGDKKRFRRNISFGLASLLVMGMMSFISTLTKAHVPNILLVDQYPVLDLIGCFLFAELLNWVFHYIKHVSSFFWKFHFQHHIESKYTVWLTTHTHGLEVLISGSFMGVCMATIGFSQTAVNIYFLFYSLANTYQHCNSNLSLGVLDYIIVSPRYHRIHHSKSYRANYGSTLTFWDVAFGTAIFPKRDEVVTDIGITSHGEPFGFVEEMLYFLKPLEGIKDSVASLIRSTSKNLQSK